jgi:hypothetical protein
VMPAVTVTALDRGSLSAALHHSARCLSVVRTLAGRDLTAWLTMQSAANQSPGTKFPANSEINREFCSIRPATAISTPGQPVNSTAFSGIPCATEQGIFKCLSGNFFRGTRKFNQQPGIASLRSDAVIAAEQSARDMSARPPTATELAPRLGSSCNLQLAGRFSEIAGRADPIGCQIALLSQDFGRSSRDLRSRESFWILQGGFWVLQGRFWELQGRRAAWNCEMVAGFGARGRARG